MKYLKIMGGLAILAGLSYIIYKEYNQYEIIEAEGDIENSEDNDHIPEYTETGICPDPAEEEYPEEPHEINDNDAWDIAFVGHILDTYKSTFQEVREEGKVSKQLYYECLLQDIDNGELWGVTMASFDVDVAVDFVDKELSSLIYRIRKLATVHMPAEIKLGEVICIMIHIMSFTNEETPEACLQYLYANGNIYNCEESIIYAYLKAYSNMNIKVPNLFGLESDCNKLPVVRQFGLYRADYVI